MEEKSCINAISTCGEWGFPLTLLVELKGNENKINFTYNLHTYTALIGKFF